jgi:hypothetical protein
MKKFTFTLMLAAVMLFTASPLFAEGMMFGVKGGLNLANLTGDDATMEGVDPSMKLGFGGGIFFGYSFTELFGIQAEALYMMKGATYEEGGVSVDTKLDYIEIPLLFKVNIPTEGKIKPAIFAGPAFGFLMSAKVEDLDIKDDCETMDIGILGGAEVGYKMEKGTIFLNASYEIGMMSIAKVDEGADDVSIKNSNIAIMVGYGYAF